MGGQKSRFRFRSRRVRLIQRDMAKLLGLTSRQLRNLTNEGMPSEVDGRSRLYGPAAIAWFVEQKVLEERERHDRSEREQLELEKLIHQNREAKVRADLAEQKVVLVSEAAEEWAESAGAIRSITLRIPVRYADWVRPDDPVAGEEALEKVVDDFLGSLQEELDPPEAFDDSTEEWDDAE